MDAGKVFDELLKSQLHLVLWDIAKWAVLGVFVGGPAGWFAHVLLSRCGAFRLQVARAGWLRALALGWLVMALGALGCVLGGCQGVASGIERAITKSQFRTEVLDPVGNAGAFGLVAIDFFLQDVDVATGRNQVLTAEYSRALEAFQQGEGEFDVVAFVERLERAEEPLVKAGVTYAKETIRKRFNLAEGTLAETVTTSVLGWTVRHVLRDKLVEELDRFGLGGPVREFFRTLPAAAAATGSPRGVTHAELAGHVVEHGAVPMLVQPIRAVIRGKQLLLGLLVFPAGALPVLCFWLGRVVERRRAAGAGAAKEAGPVA
ncbi:MAG: hypothetical protein HYZ53_07930 [Planctomycetes bacterium]|nr:hypothetical protein [Planctomycetota bacterium]